MSVFFGRLYTIRELYPFDHV